MTFQAPTPVIPKLYKVLKDGHSCSGGLFKWDTTPGVRNYLPSDQQRKPLKHCQTGFHLTTDWRKWYEFGHDVYTATVDGGEVLLKQNFDSYGRPKDCQDKVVASVVTLSQKNADPLVKLLKQFWNDIERVGKTFENVKKKRGAVPKIAILYRNCDSTVSFPRGNSDIMVSSLPGKIGWYYGTAARTTARFIIGILEKSVESSITAKERQQVHDVWNLWKKGWVVHGINSSGKYVVS